MEQPSVLLARAIAAGELVAVQQLVAAQPSLINRHVPAAEEEAPGSVTPLLLAVEQACRQASGRLH